MDNLSDEPQAKPKAIRWPVSTEPVALSFALSIGGLAGSSLVVNDTLDAGGIVLRALAPSAPWLAVACILMCLFVAVAWVTRHIPFPFVPLLVAGSAILFTRRNPGWSESVESGIVLWVIAVSTVPTRLHLRRRCSSGEVQALGYADASGWFLGLGLLFFLESALGRSGVERIPIPKALWLAAFLALACGTVAAASNWMTLGPRDAAAQRSGDAPLKRKDLAIAFLSGLARAAFALVLISAWFVTAMLSIHCDQRFIKC